MTKKYECFAVYVQGVSPGYEHLDIGRIKLHSLMTFIWARSVCSSVGAIHFLNWSIHSKKTTCKVTFSISTSGNVVHAVQMSVVGNTFVILGSIGAF
jgi:hypothetical protein